MHTYISFHGSSTHALQFALASTLLSVRQVAAGRSAEEVHDEGCREHEEVVYPTVNRQSCKKNPYVRSVS